MWWDAMGCGGMRGDAMCVEWAMDLADLAACWRTRRRGRPGRPGVWPYGPCPPCCPCSCYGTRLPEYDTVPSPSLLPRPPGSWCRINY